MAAKVAHKDAWHRRREGTRPVEGATVVGQDFVGDPLHWGQVATSLLYVLAAKSHPTPEYAWEGVDLARDAVVVDTDTIGVGVQWSKTSSADDFSKNLIRALCEASSTRWASSPAT
jgi:hypothetical protein